MRQVLHGALCLRSTPVNKWSQHTEHITTIYCCIITTMSRHGSTRQFPIGPVCLSATTTTATRFAVVVGHRLTRITQVNRCSHRGQTYENNLSIFMSQMSFLSLHYRKTSLLFYRHGISTSRPTNSVKALSVSSIIIHHDSRIHWMIFIKQSLAFSFVQWICKKCLGLTAGKTV